MIEIEIGMLVAGASGGFVKSLVEQKGRVILPVVEVADGVKYVHLGFVGNCVLGAVIAFYTASEPTAAFSAGLAASFIAEKLLERTPAIQVVAPAK